MDAQPGGAALVLTDGTHFINAKVEIIDPRETRPILCEYIALAEDRLRIVGMDSEKRQ